MPNKHAAVKDLRKNKKRAVRNALLKTHVKSLTTKLKILIKEKKEKEATELSRKLQQSIDKASKKHIFHPNKSSRRISSMHRALHTKVA